jgi:hypothetical protein
VRESHSVDLGTQSQSSSRQQHQSQSQHHLNVKAVGGGGVAGGGGLAKGVPLDSGLRTPNGEEPDPFEEFNSVTLHHDGEDEGIVVGEPVWRGHQERR